jgi:hypothetical protein
VVTVAMAGEVQDNKQHEKDNGNHPKHLYPAWGTRSRLAADPHADGVVVGGRLSHVSVLCCVISRCSNRGHFTRQCVYVKSRVYRRRLEVYSR